MNLPQANIIDTIADQRDELRDENIRLKAHIKRLEEAGENLRKFNDIWEFGAAIQNWCKVKESKP